MKGQSPNSAAPTGLKEQEPESTRTFFKNLFVWFDKATKWKRFRNTRQRIKRGEKLFDLSADELSKVNVMGPWTFNIYETVVAAIPAQMLTKVLNFFFPFEPPPLEIPESLNPYQKALAKEIIKLGPSVENFFRPFIVPSLLLVVSVIIGWACLRREDSTKQARKRCRNAYLYFDGTYGLMPQTILSLAITMLALSAQRNVDSPLIYLVSIGVLVIGFFYQIYITRRKIPKLLFQLNGYSTEGAFFNWKRNKAPNSAPWAKYDLSILLLIGPLTWIILIAFSVIQGLVVYFLAAFRVWLRGAI